MSHEADTGDAVALDPFTPLGPSPTPLPFDLVVEPTPLSGVARRPARAIPWRRYVHRINYSACNESSESELAALAPGPGQRLLCITAGGGRVLDLVTARPAEIWAVDLNPCQTALLELKLAALRELEHGDFLAFLGVRPSSDRLATYHRLAGSLSPAARALFDARPALVRRGVLYQGNLERYFRLIAPVIGLGAGRMRRLFDFTDLEEQRRWLEREWRRPLWRAVGSLLSSRLLLRFLLDDPGLLRFLPARTTVHRSILDCLKRYFHHNLGRDNHLLTMVFFGRYRDEAHLPLHLRADGFAAVKAALPATRLRLVTAPVTEVLAASEADAVDGFSLSDLPSYLTPEAFEQLLGEVVRTARPHARLCLRACLRPPLLPRRFATSIRRDHDLEDHLARHDAAAVHEFLVGRIGA